MALTVPQLESHLGRFLRLFLTHVEADVAARLLEPMSAALLNGGKLYVTDGTLGTQPERREAMETLAKALYQQMQGRDPSGAAAEHFTNHWLIQKQQGVG